MKYTSDIYLKLDKNLQDKYFILFLNKKLIILIVTN